MTALARHARPPLQVEAVLTVGAFGLAAAALGADPIALAVVGRYAIAGEAGRRAVRIACINTV